MEAVDKAVPPQLPQRVPPTKVLPVFLIRLVARLPRPLLLTRVTQPFS